VLQGDCGALHTAFTPLPGTSVFLVGDAENCFKLCGFLFLDG
jgi:hypothetical protein